MVKARIPGSSQELYTVSVESMPQYVNNSGGRSGRMAACCKGGRVGKDLLCGVLIALAVICAAVAIFLVVYYVVNNNGDGGSQLLPTRDGAPGDHNDTLDSSPLTRHREEESKLNSLSSNNIWEQQNPHQRDSNKDQLSLGSTALPDVGIHEPEFHVEGVKVYPPPYGGQQPPLSAPPTTSSSISTTELKSSTSTSTTEEDIISSSSSSTPPLMDVEEKSQDIAKKSETTQFVPDDDVIIETPSVESSSALPVDPASSSISTPESVRDDDETSSSSSSSVVPETSGFVPIRTDDEEHQDEEEEEQQTEAGPEILPANQEPAVDTAPWKPIQAVENVNRSEAVEPRFIQEDTAEQIQGVSSTSEKVPSSSSPESPEEVVVVSSSTVVTPVEDVVIPPQEVQQEEEESTEFALAQNLGDMAILLPEERIRPTSSSSSSPSPTTSSSTTPATAAESIIQIDPAKVNNQSSPFRIEPAITALLPSSAECIRRQLPFCKGVLPYSETILPNWVGDKTEGDRNLSVPYFEIIAESECHPRVQQYACAVLEPPCRDKGISLPPCRQFCRAIAEDCRSYVLSALTLSSVLDCDRFPQSNDPNVCLNLASTTPEGECLPGEYRCSSDNTCIPERWVCDGRQDCSQGDDEFSCGQCTDQEFKCESEPNRCVPQRWRCDGSRDCADGSDERDCPSNEECGDGQFRCEDGLSCIPLRRVCDGSNHCRDNSDEVNCTSIVCQNDDFKCKENGVCIPRQWICDNNWDCKDGSDEADCPALNDAAELLDDDDDSESESSSEQLNSESSSGNSTAFNPEKCPLGELLCISDMSCIRFEQLCDGTKDCSDGADETDCSSD